MTTRDTTAPHPHRPKIIYPTFREYLYHCATCNFFAVDSQVTAANHKRVNPNHHMERIFTILGAKAVEWYNPLTGEKKIN